MTTLTNTSQASHIVTEALDTLTLPFGGSRLIEASAGTGKTYTIAGLYVRLLLGHGIEAPLTCEQILVVTFTNAATGELRDRIRKKIQLAYRCFIGLAVDDELINSLYRATPEASLPIARKRLDLALKSLDEAAIFTIHGFCQRILADMAFESSLLFESEFTLDDSEFLHHAVRDFWREKCYPLSGCLADAIVSKFSDPDALSRQLRPLLGASSAVASPKPQPFDKLEAELTQSLSRFKLIWPREREQTETLLNELPLNGARFGKKADGYPKLAKMLDDLDNWVAFGQALPPAKVLEALSLNGLKLNKGGEVPTAQQAPMLDHIERLAELIANLIPSFLYCARDGIATRFAKQKLERNLLTPDDLLLTLANALTASKNSASKNSEPKDSSLAMSIAQRFPVALIDEFQDTDPLQFEIFNSIYQSASATNTLASASAQNDKLSLLMIGDPKQAIYAFRGADIHTYIQARAQTAKHYNLDTNYRSNRQMVDAVNCIFSHRDDPFISQSIPFEPVKASSFADKKVLNEKSADNSALRLRLLSEESEKGLNKTTARQLIAEDVADEIAKLLIDAQQNLCAIGKKPLRAKDIAILVRDRHEANVVRAALSQRQIGSVFLSRDSVFNTLEARELALVLYAMADPKDERALRSALATSLLGYSAEAIHSFNQDEDKRQTLLEQFAQLHQVWLKRGIMPALLTLASQTQIIERLLNGEEGDRRLTDFRHLGELLQQKATELDGSSALINWYEQALIENLPNEEAQLRLESEQNLVQVVTIHKSKGLEYPICFVPFVSLSRDNRKRPAPMLYHDDNQLIWDIEQTDEGWERQKRETLAEDLRLLYVALTRPVLKCYLYITNHSRFTKKSGMTSQLHETAIGYLLGVEDKACDYERLLAQAKLLEASDPEAISLTELAAAGSDQQREPNLIVLQTEDNAEQQLAPKELNRPQLTPWRVGSYSGLVKHLAHEKVLPGMDDEQFPELDVIQDEVDSSPSRFTFERGANAGSFMHLVLELIDFTQAQTDLEVQLPIAMAKYGIDESWTEVLKDWYLDLLHAPLANDNSLMLAQLKPTQKLVEMEFYLPITQLNADKLNSLLLEFGYSAGLNFDELQGMLKGFVDLTFEHNNQFFIADYKSNHLGDDLSQYHYSNMQQAIRSHRYDLQYIIYTLALHRYLTLRMANYDYELHIGGSFYLFLRGMSTSSPQSGVFYDKPPKLLIEKLDALFGNIMTAANSEQMNSAQVEAQ
ncbi:exodeoxyribonuclease V subunit beta [Shewanella schlegeliana]|uniref:RecBCD enzyme subunit RecB n=1 Tax=Shewanella schlegeliana TaxID=190308 RepID=A0ABS1SVB8_9GAMM|nr:exodeoxyribonuclease V subunit beta [Shewanella schlegeliana]MBL4911960.1 exodeoxyribonuclease V subunit beta [Shewanella schlegeliana]MCL1110087.1 exodeoxyribonuclease V subunit beta [Shewanella schlegeliana]